MSKQVVSPPSPPAAPVGPKLLLTFVEAGELLGVGRSSVYRLVRERQLPVVRPAGKCARIPRTAVEEYVAELVNERSPAVEARLPYKSAGQGRDADPE